MKLPRSLYARPAIVRGEQCAGARPDAGRCWAAVQWWRRSGPPCRCRHRGAVLGGRASAGAVTWARSGPPSGRSPARGCPRRRPGRRCPVHLLWSAVGMSVQPVERTSNVQGVRCPVSGRPGIQVSGRTSSGVRGAAATLSAPRRTLEWLGVAGRPRLGPTGRCAPWSAGGVAACRLRPDGKGMVRRWPWLARTRVDPSPGPPLGRRPGCGAAWPPGRHGRWSRVPAGWRGSMGRSRCSPAPAGRSGQVVGVVPDHGLDQEVVTTLRGRWLVVVVPCRSAPEGPLGSVGSSLRPQRGRGV